jgi:putative sigma-54 modulation protein
MRLHILAHAFVLTPTVRQQIERRLLIALRSFGRHIDEVSVSVRDVNGPRGGPGMRGQVIVHLRRGNPIVVRAKSDNINTLVSQLATTVRRAVRSRIRRRRMQFIRLFRRRRRPFDATKIANSSHPGEQLEDRAMQFIS